VPEDDLGGEGRINKMNESNKMEIGWEDAKLHESLST